MSCCALAALRLGVCSPPIVGPGWPLPPHARARLDGHPGGSGGPPGEARAGRGRGQSASAQSTTTKA
eukprot:4657589-Alexandrium_andersonii.AAC.1